MFSLLTLDDSTLFYYTLSDASQNNQKHLSINKWASAIKSTSMSQARSTSSRAKTKFPSLTIGSSAPSILSDNVKIMVKTEPGPAISTYNNGGLSDSDEIRGEERDFAINSPPKGKKRINSEVLLFP